LLTKEQLKIITSTCTLEVNALTTENSPATAVAFKHFRSQLVDRLH